MAPKPSKLRKVLLLDVPAIILALLMGAVIFYFGGISYFILMLVFLALGIIVTKYGYYEKKQIGLYEHERSWENVIANGLVPSIALFFSPAAFIGSIAAITSDKFASEMGVLGGDPINVLNLKHSKKGKSGCVSFFGTWMSFVGALLIGLLAIYLFSGDYTLYHALLFGFIGFIGSIVDTLFGVPEEMGFGNKSTTNIICALTGAILGFLLF